MPSAYLFFLGPGCCDGALSGCAPDSPLGSFGAVLGDPPPFVLGTVCAGAGATVSCDPPPFVNVCSGADACTVVPGDPPFFSLVSVSAVAGACTVPGDPPTCASFASVCVFAGTDASNDPTCSVVPVGDGASCSVDSTLSGFPTTLVAGEFHGRKVSGKQLSGRRSGRTGSGCGVDRSMVAPYFKVGAVATLTPLRLLGGGGLLNPMVPTVAGVAGGDTSDSWELPGGKLLPSLLPNPGIKAPAARARATPPPDANGSFTPNYRDFGAIAITIISGNI